MPTLRRLNLEPIEPRLVPDGTIPPLEPGLVHGRVWADADADGVIDAGEAGVANVTVQVRSADGADLVAGMKTEADGGYSLPLPVGNYVLKVVAPADHGFTKAGAIDLGGAGNSGVGAETGTADFYAAAQSPVTLNAGVVRTAAPGRGADFGFGFAKTTPGQVAGPNAVAVDAAGNTYVTGYTASTVSPQDPITDPFVAKYDGTGKLVWKKPVGPGGYVPAAVAVDAAGRVFVTGATKFENTMGVMDPPEPAGPPADVFVEQFAADGTPGWRKTFGEDGVDGAAAVVADTAGNVFVGGMIGTEGEDGGRAWLIKLSAATGDVNWTRAVGGAGGGFVRAVVSDGQGGAWFAGSVRPPAGAMTAVVGHVDAAGTVHPLWKLRGGEGSFASAAGLARDAAGNLYVTGDFGGPVDFDPTAGTTELTPKGWGVGLQYGDVFVAKLGPDGTPAWVRTVGGEFSDTAAGFDRGPGGALYLVGTFSGTADFDPGPGVIKRSGVDTPFLLELDGNGTFVRAQVAAKNTAPGWLTPGAIKADAAGRLHLAGSYDGEADADPTAGQSLLPEGPGGYLAVWTKKPVTPPPPATNGKPVVTPLAPITVVEGKPLSLSIVATDPENDPITVAWDLNGDGVYKDAGGATLNLTWSQLAYFGITDSGPARPIGARVSDGKSAAVPVVTTLTVKNAAPTAPLTLAGTVTEGGIGKVMYGRATDATAPDRAAGFRYAYDLDNDGKWDMGDGKTFAGGVTATSAVIPPALLVNSGTRIVRARIFDKDNGFTETRLTVPVRNAAPRATFKADGPVAEGSPAVVRFTGVTDVSPADTKAGFRYSYDFNNDGVYEVGDGRTFAGSVATATAKVPATVLRDNGTYPVRARVFDKDGGAAEYLAVVKVNNAPPTAEFTLAGPAVPGQPTAFEFKTVSDPGPRDVAAGFRYWLDWDGQRDVRQVHPPRRR